MKGKKADPAAEAADLTMAERSEVEQIVEKVVSQVLEDHIPQLREELVRRVLEELPQSARGVGSRATGRQLSQPAEGDLGHPLGYNPKRNLARAAGQHGALQRRGALFVVKAGAATGWQGRGFTERW